MHSSFGEKNIANNAETETQLRIFKIPGDYLEGNQMTGMLAVWDKKSEAVFKQVGGDIQSCLQLLERKRTIH